MGLGTWADSEVNELLDVDGIEGAVEARKEVFRQVAKSSSTDSEAHNVWVPFLSA